MKTRLIAFLFTAGLILSFAFKPQETKECNVEEALKACKRKILPFSFLDRKTITFSYGTETQMKEFKFQQFKGERYRFVFNRTYSPGTEFEVYNAPKEKSGRKLLYNSREAKEKSNLLVFHPENMPYIYVDLIIPVDNNKIREGCATIMVGYELTFED